MNPHTIKGEYLLLTTLTFLMVAMSNITIAQADDNNQGSEQSKELEILTFEQAIKIALEQSPILAASESKTKAALEGQSQRDALPNPDISIEADNIYGDGSYNGMNGAEITYGVTQLVEMPNKRRHRQSIAEADSLKAAYDQETTKLDLVHDVKVAYAKLIAAHDHIKILEDSQNLAIEVLKTVSLKVDAGKEPLIQKNKADIELSSRRIELDRAKRELQAHKKHLSTLMGTDNFFAYSLNTLGDLKEPEPLAIYQTRLSATPDVMKSMADVQQAEAVLSFEKANAIPDPTLSFGLKNFREDNRQAFMAGVSFPLPVFNLNRSGVKRAGHELNVAKLSKQGRYLSLEMQLVETYSEYQNAFSEAIALKNDVLPRAEEIFDFARTGYEAGKFGYLDVLDAQRTLFDVRKQLNTSILSYQQKKALVERLSAVIPSQDFTQVKEK